MKLILVLSPEYPPENTPRTGDGIPPAPDAVLVKSPKSSAFPVVAMVTKSITFVVGPSPPAKTPRVLSDVPVAL